VSIFAKQKGELLEGCKRENDIYQILQSKTLNNKIVKLEGT